MTLAGETTAWVVNWTTRASDAVGTLVFGKKRDAMKCALLIARAVAIDRVDVVKA